MTLKDKKIIVFGGAGFIGSHTVDYLISQGASVAVVDNLVTGRRENLNPQARFYEMNINDPNIEEIFQKENPEIVYHFAFNVLVPKSVVNPLVDIDSIAGSIRILAASREFGVKRIVFASTGFVYGNNPNLPLREDSAMDPVSPYAIAKFAVENYLKFFRKTYGLDYVILRYPAVYGPRQVTGAMADYIRKLRRGDQAEIWGDGTKTRDYVYVADVVRANALALDLEDLSDPVFNIGTNKETTLNELYQMIASLLNKEAKPMYLPDRPGEQIRYCLDSSKASKILGWSPQYSLKEGLKLRIESE